ncbi:DUF1003 domain-containing protein [Rhizobiaceae bacterium n13]|uniref:DUF1003 domain-containing protein n=1 Tax=Ferirhizobium litorale TaxID=2927786 RepID=A0AAE3U2N0_9HYPH|nr:DUF1003 domain-containing protein [Fererhizobium litorale]MDI7863874.1 DUF1003 domain-containing protein [Fererhizobium litorale]MDI7924294.1 DUF1003 domain-containing protein [Fererhizobium litorale]
MSILHDLENLHFGKHLAELGEIEKRVIEKTRERKIVATNVNEAFSAQTSVGERLADGIARVGGSWGFIIGFLVFLIIWASLNTFLVIFRPFDPYPFIFLNLILSMVAAIQAPIIMMSQNRQAARDRFEAAKDYEINLKAEIEVLSLHQKIDQQVIAELERLRADMARLSNLLDTRTAP